MAQCAVEEKSQCIHLNTVGSIVFKSRKEACSSSWKAWSVRRKWEAGSSLAMIGTKLVLSLPGSGPRRVDGCEKNLTVRQDVGETYARRPKRTVQDSSRFLAWPSRRKAVPHYLEQRAEVKQRWRGSVGSRMRWGSALQ